MIEQSIFFALGCIVTALCALAFGPIFWSRALRLTRKRLQLQVPLSMQEILADRDQLRAEFAVERLRIEQAMDRVKETKAHDMAMVGRMSVEAARRCEEIVKLRCAEAAQAYEIGSLLRAAVEAQAEAGALRKALDDAHAIGERHQDYARRAHAAHGDLRRESSDRAATIASLETRLAEQETKLAELVEAARDTRVEDGLRSRLETAMRHAARHEASGLTTRRELDEAKTLIRALQHGAEASRQLLEEGREREKGLHLQRSLLTEQARAKDRLAEQLETLNAENLALQKTLASANGADHPAARGDDGDLRASIHALGVAVAEMVRSAQAAPPAPSLPAETTRAEASSA